MESQTPSQPSRRDIVKGLGLLTWAALVAALGLGLGALLRLAGGSRSGGPAPPVVLVPPERLAPGQVLEQEGVALMVDEGGIYALSLVCPHLGCRPAWQPATGRFLCPCHGSSFARDGGRLAGPTPRGLAHLAVTQDAQGRLRVDPRRPVADQERLRKRGA
ncbi:MAG: ubiquinol-cytochrome c reductase iron-sulfur subunit [Pseudomonadota bacterium]